MLDFSSHQMSLNYTGVRLKGRAGDFSIVLLGGLRPPEARPGQKTQERPVRRTSSFLDGRPLRRTPV